MALITQAELNQGMRQLHAYVHTHTHTMGERERDVEKSHILEHGDDKCLDLWTGSPRHFQINVLRFLWIL